MNGEEGPVIEGPDNSSLNIFPTSLNFQVSCMLPAFSKRAAISNLSTIARPGLRAASH